MRYSLADAAKATQGTTTAPQLMFNGVSTDTRTLKPGNLFVAIKGENFDGHDYIGQAMSAGACAVVTSRQVDAPHVLVDDTLAALGQLAAFHASMLSARVIGVTGSSGKTSTKDLLAQVLSTFGETLAPPGSFNNEIGLPSTVLAATKDTDFLVLEMGMRGLGHISYLCSIAQPEVGILLNVGSAHVELLGSADAIAQAKSEIIRDLPAHGVAVLFADDARVLNLRTQTNAQIITFGESKDADIRIADLEIDRNGRPTVAFEYKDRTHSVSLQLTGEHQAFNAAAVIAACVGLGLDFDAVCAALSNATNISKWRMEVTNFPGDITVINDSYNANPESMRAGLKALKAMSQGRRSWAVLGEMRELGDQSLAAHDELGRLCVRLDVNKLVAIGTAGKIIQMGAAQEGSWGDEAQHVSTPAAAVAVLKSEVKSGDVIFIKASRAVGLESVASELIDYFSRENTDS